MYRIQYVSIFVLHLSDITVVVQGPDVKLSVKDSAYLLNKSNLKPCCVLSKGLWEYEKKFQAHLESGTSWNVLERPETLWRQLN